MKKTRTMVAGVAALAAVATVTACNSAATNQETSASPVSSQTSGATPAAAHNHADMMFAHHMIPHHQQAIQMSDMILAKQGIDPRVVDLAKKIKDAQGPEIDTMQGWLNQWGMSGMPSMTDMPGMPSMPSMSGTPGPGMPGMSGMPGMPGMPGMGSKNGMPGMMSPADMQSLQNAQGTDASKMFLTQMIAHHQGAITMAQDEIKNGQSPEAITLAKSIASSQAQEIDTMNGILKSL